MQVIRLEIRGIGHCPSFKNSKVVGVRKLFTKPEYKLWMDRCIQSLELQLLSAIQMDTGGTRTGSLPLSSIVLSGLCDDSKREISSETVFPMQVPKGEEGVELFIELASENSASEITELLRALRSRSSSVAQPA